MSSTGNEDCRNLNSLSSGGAMPPATRRQPQSRPGCLVVLVVPLRHPVADVWLGEDVHRVLGVVAQLLTEVSDDCDLVWIADSGQGRLFIYNFESGERD